MTARKSTDLTPLEEDLLAALDRSAVQGYRAGFAAALPDGGEQAGGTARAVAYIRSRLRAWAIPTTIHRFDALVGEPGAVRLSLARRAAPVPAIVHPYSAATPDEGLVAELRPTGAATASDDRLAGGIAILAGPPTPATIARIAAQGALAQIYISPDEALDPVPVPNVWGGVAPNPVLSISRATGEGFLALCAAGPTPVRLSAGVTWTPRRLLLPVATVSGVEEPQTFLMVGANAPGPGDDGATAALLLELCRLLAEHSGRLRRGLRFAWWPSGAAPTIGPVWYTAHTWEDLGQHLASYVELGDPARAPGDGWAELSLRHFAGSTVRDAGGKAPSWDTPFPDNARAFARLGLPSLHLDADPATILPMLARLCTAPLLPFDSVSFARAIDARLHLALDTVSDRLDLSPFRGRVAAFQAASERLHLALLHLAQADSPNYEEGLEIANRAQLRLHRLLLPALRHAGDPYATPALTLPTELLPGIEAALSYAPLFGEVASADAAILRDSALHERNRLVDALSAGTVLIDEALAALRPLGFG